jgi:hypothetical protein
LLFIKEIIVSILADTATNPVSVQNVSLRTEKVPIELIGERVAAEIRQRGLDVERLPHERSSPLRKRMLLINGKKCALAYTGVCTFQSEGCQRPYSHLAVSRRSLQTAEFLIVLQETQLGIRHWWVIPSAVLLEAMGENDRQSFYLPVYPRPAYRGAQSIVDWWAYEDAWRLLYR